MSSKDKIKFKYRIVINDCTEYPYRVEKKGRFFWDGLGKCRSQNEAEEEIQKLVKLEVMRPGSVIYEFSEADLVVQKLKGTGT